MWINTDVFLQTFLSEKEKLILIINTFLTDL